MQLTDLVRLALEEDIGPGDLTTEACVPVEATGGAWIVAKQRVVVCGHAPAAECFRQLGATYDPLEEEGAEVAPGTRIAGVVGPARALLMAERTALNFLMRLCGIATHTRETVKGVSRMRVTDTRKTTPLMRRLERNAVRVGGAANHRYALFDGILIKDNHISAAGGVGPAIEAARARAHHLVKIEVECESHEQVDEALTHGADVIMLDNMDDVGIARAVRTIDGRALVEVSGNVTRARLPRLEGMGVDLVSIGGLIHQATWADLSMKWEAARVS